MRGSNCPIKTSRNGSVVGITKTQYGARTSASSGKYGRRAYSAGEIELFFIYTGPGLTYLIPFAAVEGLKRISLSGTRGTSFSPPVRRYALVAQRQEARS